METIDIRVEKVLEIENKRKTHVENDLINTMIESSPFFESIKPEYTIVTKDTIGKSIYFNTPRR